MSDSQPASSIDEILEELHQSCSRPTYPGQKLEKRKVAKAKLTALLRRVEVGAAGQAFNAGWIAAVGEPTEGINMARQTYIGELEAELSSLTVGGE